MLRDITFQAPPLGSNFKVNDTGSGQYPAIAMGESGNFVVTWHYQFDIYAQRYNSSGTPLDSNFRVNDDTVWTAIQISAAIAMDGAGNFVITWKDERDEEQYGSDIYAQRYNSAGTPLGSNFRVNDDSLLWDQVSPAVAMDASGNFVITWQTFGLYIYAQRYDSAGTPLDSNFRVDEDYLGLGWAWYPPDVAMGDSGDFTITWEDWRYGRVYPIIYAQTYYPSGERMTSNYLVPNHESATFAQARPGVAAKGSNFYFTWQDNRRAKGWDIYANIKAFHPPGPFSLLSPWNKKFIPMIVHFDWEDAADPCPLDQVRYDLYVIAVSVLPPDTTIDSNLIESECEKALDPGIYCWTVKAKDTWGAERWSNQTRHFIITGLRPFLGDLNGDGSINGADVVFLINYLYKSGTAPDPLELADANCDGVVNAGDVVFLINYLFKDGPPPSC